MFNKLFGKSKKELVDKEKLNDSKNVHCEVTGKETLIDNTVVLVKIDGVIVLKNLNNPTIDFENKEIQSQEKPLIKFYSEIVVPEDLKPVFGRIFSIVNDEEDIEQSTAVISTEGQKTYFGQKLLPFMEHINNGLELLKIPSTMFFAVIDKYAELEDKTCQNWNTNYSGLGRKYRFKSILKEQKENQTFATPGILALGFDVAVSDCSQKNPNGTGYLYETDGNFKPINICSNESAVSFCQKNNAIIYYNDFLNNGKLRVLTPVTESVNKNLQNPYLFRSLNI
jgi:hypothetical protein